MIELIDGIGLWVLRSVVVGLAICAAWALIVIVKWTIEGIVNRARRRKKGDGAYS